MGKGKLKKFEELESMNNVIQKPGNQMYSGSWHEEFGNGAPIVLELACGKGHYTVELAKRFPHHNFIGVDIKGNRIHVGARQALQENLNNVRFLRMFIDHLDEQFAQGEVEAIWITFPDPFLRKSKANKRLTSPKFLSIYQKVLKPKGRIKLKTDSPELFAYTLEVIENHQLKVHQRLDDVYSEEHNENLLTDIQTYYEKMHLDNDRIIRYLEFSIPTDTVFPT